MAQTGCGESIRMNIFCLTNPNTVIKSHPKKNEKLHNDNEAEGNQFCRKIDRTREAELVLCKPDELECTEIRFKWAISDFLNRRVVILFTWKSSEMQYPQFWAFQSVARHCVSAPRPPN